MIAHGRLSYIIGTFANALRTNGDFSEGNVNLLISLCQGPHLEWASLKDEQQAVIDLLRMHNRYMARRVTEPFNSPSSIVLVQRDLAEAARVLNNRVFFLAWGLDIEKVKLDGSF